MLETGDVALLWVLVPLVKRYVMPLPIVARTGMPAGSN
jgi:hypothetical protein